MPASDGRTPGVDPTEVAALLALPPEEFVAARTARAKELRAEGRRTEAAAMAKLRKPLRLVWVLGELARRNPEVAEAAADVAAQVERAMAAGAGGVRPLLAAFRDVVAEVAGLADDLDGTVDRLQVGLALREVLADPDARRAWVGGWLLAMPGDDDVALADPGDELAARRAAKAGSEGGGRRGVHPSGDVPPEARPAKARRPRRTKEEVEADRARRAEEKEAAAQEAARRDALLRAEAAQIVADGAVTLARQNHEAAVTALTDLEARLVALQAEVTAAREGIGASEQAVAVAEERRDAAHAALAALGGAPRRGGSGRRR